MIEDKLLVLRCKGGSPEALTRVYQKYRRDLLLLAMALLNDKALAEDVVHDVFLSFVGALAGFRLTGSLKGFLLTCAANHARNKNRAARPRPRPQADEPMPQRWESEAPVESLVCNEQLRRLADALGQLPYEQREIITLHLQTGMAFAAIARMQGVSINTAKSRYRYGVGKLRFLLNGEQET